MLACPLAAVFAALVFSLYLFCLLPPRPPSGPPERAASESNLLKIRIKQRVIEKRAMTGPLAAARRQERLQQAAQRRMQQKQAQLSGNHPPGHPHLAALGAQHPASRYPPRSIR